LFSGTVIANNHSSESEYREVRSGREKLEFHEEAKNGKGFCLNKLSCDVGHRKAGFA
jgi:hypothetical protein